MVEVYKNLFVGSQQDYETNKTLMKDWRIVHACKIPYHKALLGYTGNVAPKDDSRYLFGYDDNGDLVLNIIDVADPAFYNEGMMNEAINFVIKALNEGKHVLIHCNQGESRAPTLALLVLNKIGFYKCNFNDSRKHFKLIYNSYCPNKGIFDYVEKHWNKWGTL